MKTIRRVSVAAVVLAAMATAGLAKAADESAAKTEPVLKAIPDNALGFLLVKDLAKTDKALARIGTLVQSPIPSVLELFKQQVGIQGGLDEHGSAALALLPDNDTDNGPPSIVPIVFLPVSDYAKFIAPLRPDDAKADIAGVTIAGQPMVVGHKGSFALFARVDQKEQLVKAIASNSGIDSVVGSFDDWMRHHQISLIVTPRGTKLALPAIATKMKQIRSILPASPTNGKTAQIEAAFKMYDTVLSKAADEIEAFGIGIRVDDRSDVSIDSHTTFLAGGSWAAAFKGLKPATEKPFADLPSGSLIGAFEGAVPKKWSKGLGSFGWEYVFQMEQFNGADKLNDDQRKKLKNAGSTMMRGVSSMSILMTTPKSGQTLYDGLIGLMKVEDSEQFLEQYQKSIELMSDAVKDIKNSPLKVTGSEKFEIDGTKGIAITMDLSGILLQSDPQTAKLMPILFGTDGKLTARLIAADEHTVLFAYGNEAHAKQALADFKSPKSTLASDSDVAKVLKLLPVHAQWKGILSIDGYLGFIKDVAVAAGAPNIFPQLPAMPPVGFAAEGGPHGLTTHLAIPKETIEGISNTVQSYMQHQAPSQN